MMHASREISNVVMLHESRIDERVCCTHGLQDNRFASYMDLYTFIVAMINFPDGFYIKTSGLESMLLNEETNYGP